MNKRRWIVFGGSSAAAVLMLASASFACSYYKGYMNATGSGSTATSSARGNGTGMGYCDTTTNLAKLSTGNHTGTVTVSGGAYTCNGTSYHLTDTVSAYSLNEVAGFWQGAPGEHLIGQDCMNNSTTRGVKDVTNYTANPAGLTINPLTGDFGPYTSISFTDNGDSLGRIGICFSTKGSNNTDAPQVPIQSV